MSYSKYKKHYSDCSTVKGSYNPDLKTIVVEVPEGRMKPSGVRGQRFSGYQLWIEKNGKKYVVCFRATCLRNAEKQRITLCKKEGYTPCDPPEGYINKVFIWSLPDESRTATGRNAPPASRAASWEATERKWYFAYKPYWIRQKKRKVRKRSPTHGVSGKIQNCIKNRP